VPANEFVLRGALAAPAPENPAGGRIGRMKSSANNGLFVIQARGLTACQATTRWVTGD
jgi:hypothetical protein